MTAIDGLLGTRTDTHWCSGCGDYVALDTVQALLPGLGLGQIVVYTGIGCAVRTSLSVDIDGVHVVHGQQPAAAASLATRRPDLSVWVVIRDGHTMMAGGNELITAMQRNAELKILLYDNQPDPLSLQCGISFLARVSYADRPTLVDVLTAAGKHRGAALVQVRPKGQRVSPAGILRQVQH
ncbi:thiamine pyrophosphate-dependent enzyme [Actinocrispum sp. NPDC049592]|uniref:thiamine pyrophosphate-dependent enzyme n=1 Tax=Actinocrispum sp. NPDC049592 TaxID=3154835 RepID=UPI00343FB759